MFFALFRDKNEGTLANEALYASKNPSKELRAKILGNAKIACRRKLNFQF